MAGEAILTGIFGDVTDKDHRKAFEGLRTDARTALEYIRYYREGIPSQRLTEMIAMGESARQEFKATLRWNLRSERNDDAVTYACVKTVAAFLNSEGGRLLIGVADDGGIVGIERDGFDNFDKFQLRLMDTLKHHLGEAAAADVAVEVIQAAGAGTVCLVNCTKSSTPVYCRLKNGEEHFYVRTGPGTTQLPPREMVTYLTNHFHVGTTPLPNKTK
jgi:predicted HTH transcriptional regulator